MHSENLEYLCRATLAQVLGCPIGKLHRDVLSPLGQEAAATSTSSFLFTRHRLVAEAIVMVLEKDFAEDVSELYIDLAKAAINAASDGQVINAELSIWRYKIAEHFFESDRKELALRIAQGVLSCDKLEPRLITNLATLYRKANMLEKAIELFRKVPASAKIGNRSFYFEWANAEGVCGDHVASVVLAAFSISDDCPAPRVDNVRAKLSLGGLGVAFGELFNKYRDVALRDARIAIAILGQQLHLDSTGAGYFKKHLEESIAQGAKRPSVEQSFSLLKSGLAAAESIGLNDAVEVIIPDAAHLDFKGLQQLIYASTEAGRR